MAERHHIASEEELATDGSRLITEIRGKEIAVFRVNGEYYGVLNYCVHQAGPLCEGRVVGDTEIGDDGWSWVSTREGEIISCPWHAWKFDIKGGKCIDDDRYSVPTYDVEVEDGEVYVRA
ncbi:Rieske (2Fe-2S) protein [Haladaptatus sp. ZSTT2]|uniref:Rieske (2Fe-2S) protein n=1 Tax=Haladaptatus sp. ZSTT2 TaxID=3120515 RepID=UPI00300EA8C8